MASRRSPIGENPHAGQAHKKLRDINQRIHEEEERLRVLKLLQKGDLCTRDIMAFMQQQIYKQRIMKSWDIKTSRRAMGTKIKDSRKFIHHNRIIQSQIKKQYLTLLDNKKFKLRQTF